MDIQYVANARFPSRKAHTHQIVQMCDGFANGGHDVELVAPRRWSPSHTIDAPPEEYYDTPFDFVTSYLPCLDFLWLIPSLPSPLARPIFYVQAATFTLAATVYTGVADADAVYARSLLFAAVAGMVLRRPVVVEVHRGPPDGVVRAVLGHALDRLDGLVVISGGLLDEWEGVTDVPMMVAPDAVDPGRFDLEADVRSVRSSLSLPVDRQLAVYVGSIQRWKGADTLVAAARRLDGIDVCLVGGTDDQLSWLRGTAGPVPENVHLTGHVPPAEVPKYMHASDVLVVPNTAERDISARYTSPLKVFEYMAAARPIVASDIPALREVLDESCAYFCAPDDAESLAAAIETACSDEAAEERAGRARERVVAEHTWVRRGERITEAFLT